MSKAPAGRGPSTHLCTVFGIDLVENVMAPALETALLRYGVKAETANREKRTPLRTKKNLPSYQTDHFGYQNDAFCREAIPSNELTNERMSERKNEHG